MRDSVGLRLSQARSLLPGIREELAREAARWDLPDDLCLDPVPIVDDGLVGYEVVPSWPTFRYLTIGCDANAGCVLRESSYRVHIPPALRVASIDGREIDGAVGVLPRVHHFDTTFADWSTAAAAMWRRLAAMFPQEPRHRIQIRDEHHRGVDEALAIAYSHLAACDPYIGFCGLPNEAQLGYKLTHPAAGGGLLTSRHPGEWSLWFQSPVLNLYEEWTTSVAEGNEAWGCANPAPRGSNAINLEHGTRPRRQTSLGRTR